MDEKKLQLSVVVPVMNEQDNISPLYQQITAALDGKYTYEIIFIDDGSTDDTYNRLVELHQNDEKVVIINFRKNFGQTAALSAGFDRAKGLIIAALDGDLQNDPADIPMMIDKLNQGYDVVSGWRKKRHDKALTRLLPSITANWLIAKITGVKLHDFGCTLKIYNKHILDQINLYGEMHRFIPALASWNGAKICEMVVNHRPRIAGNAKYGLARTFKVVLDLITVKFLGSYSTKPIYIFGGMGMACIVGSFFTGALVLYQKFLAAPTLSMNRNPLFYLTVLLVTAAIQFVLMGLLAELLIRTYHESQGRPTYVIKDIIESKSHHGDSNGQTS